MKPDDLGFDPSGLAAMHAAMSRFVTERQVAGICWLLARGNHVVEMAGVGVCDLATQQPLGPETVLRIYSMTKPIVTTAMMMLYDEGRWHLDDSIERVLPELAQLSVYAGLDDRGQIVSVPAQRSATMRELLSHTAGFGYGVQATGHPVDAMFIDRGVLRAANLRQLVDRVATIPLKFQPGSSWGYSIATDVLGLVLERLSGVRLGQFLAERVFGPLRMHDTGFTLTEVQGRRLATMYVGDELVPAKDFLGAELRNSTQLDGFESGGGGLFSTLADYARFCSMLRTGETETCGRVLSTEALRLMATDVLAPETARAVAGNDAVGFGLGLLIAKDPLRLGLPVGPGTLSFAGAGGTWFWIDPLNDLYCVGGVQRLDGNIGELTASVAREAVYAALIDSSR